IVVKVPGILLLFLSIFLFLPCIGLLGCCLGGIVLDVSRNLVNGAASNTWPTAEGKVISSNVRTSKRQLPRSGIDETVYQADVHYEYAVAGRRYSSSRVSFSGYGPGDRSHADNIVNRYPAGSPVTVFYSPDAPETSVLERGVTWGPI